jgi:hypothetical protein
VASRFAICGEGLVVTLELEEAVALHDQQVGIWRPLGEAVPARVEPTLVLTGQLEPDREVRVD